MYNQVLISLHFLGLLSDLDGSISVSTHSKIGQQLKTPCSLKLESYKKGTSLLLSWLQRIGLSLIGSHWSA